MLEKKNFQRLLLFIVSLALLSGGCVRHDRSAFRRRPRAIRVALLRGAGKVTVSSKSTLTVRDADTRKLLCTAKHGNRITIRLSPEGMNIAGAAYPSRSVRVRSTSNETCVNGKNYPGSLNIIRRGGGLLAVNVVDLQSYLEAVVPSEMPASWPQEALKAQAVVSRSFVLFHALRGAGKDYDIVSTTQVYNPDKQDKRTDEAVRATRNIVLFYKGELLLTYFSTCCGGFTEFASNVWQVKGNFPPPVRCPFCRSVPGYRWRARMSTAELQRKLGSAGIADAHSIAVHRRSTSGGRITALKIKCRGGEKIVGINRFRMTMGPSLIRSGFFDIESHNGYITFSGRGWGHGVGMCQRGAKVIAERGKSFESILKHYFPGARTKKMRL